MAIKTVHQYVCDICEKNYDIVQLVVNEYSNEVITSISIEGYYKPRKQVVKDCICKNCSNEILKTIIALMQHKQ